MRTQQTTLEASTSHTLPLDTSDKQTHDYTSANPNRYLARERNDHSKSFQQFLQEDTTQPHFDIAAARQQQRNKKIEDTITHYMMYSNFKSYHHLLIDSGASTHVCPKDYAPDLPLRPCGEPVPQLYTVTNKKIPVYGINYVPYKQDNFRIMMPYYVCEDMDLTSLHDTAPHHTWTTTSAPHKTLRTFLPTSREDRHPYRSRHLPNDYRHGKSIAVTVQQQEQIAPLTHTDQGLRQILGGNTD